MLTRLYILLALFLSLLFTLLVALVAAYHPANPAPIAIYHSPYPVITPDNAARLTPVAILSRGGDNYYGALEQPKWSPNGRYLAAMSRGGEEDPLTMSPWLYTTRDFSISPRLLGHEGILIDMVFSPDANWIATISHPGYVGGKMVVWEVNSGRQQFDFEGYLLFDIYFNSDRTRMASLIDGTLRMWDTESRQEVITLQDICGFDLDETVTIVVIAYCYDSFAVLSLYAVGKSQQAFIDVPENLNHGYVVAMSPDLRRLVTADGLGTIKLWGLSPYISDTTLVTGEEHLNDNTHVEFSPDGAVLATWLRTGDTIYLWSVETGRPIAALGGHAYPGSTGSGGTYLNVEFSPDGNLLASSWGDGGLTEDRNLRLWDTATGTLVRTLPDEFSATFSPDGTMLATDSGDGTVKIWAVPVTF